MLILAHRGLSATDRPENTTAAVVAAFDSGADGVEVDLRLTADGVLSLNHDPDLRRLTGLPLVVAESPWRVLYDTALQRGLRLARVEDVLTLATGRRVVLELKKPPHGPAGEARTAVAAAEQLHLHRDAGVEMDVTVSSFSPTLVRMVRALLPPSSGVRTALLGQPLDPARSVLRQALEAGHDEVHPHLLPLLADPYVVDAAHACGVGVVPWTVNRRRDMRHLELLGVDCLITDAPDMALAETAHAAT